MIMNMMRYMLGKLKVQRGATAVEYALMVALIAAVIVGTVGLLGTTVDGIFSDVSAAISGDGAATPAPTPAP